MGVLSPRVTAVGISWHSGPAMLSGMPLSHVRHTRGTLLTLRGLSLPPPSATLPHQSMKDQSVQY